MYAVTLLKICASVTHPAKLTSTGTFSTVDDVGVAVSTTTSDVDLVGDDVVENIARAAVLAALTGAFAYVSFPNPLSTGGVPVTLQVLGVFLAGIFLGPLWGGVSMGLYIVAGALGAPIFAGASAGVGVLLGPTGGYIWSYPVAAVLVGVVVHDGLELRSPRAAGLPRLVGSMVLAVPVIYLGGMASLILAGGYGLVESFFVGAAPFLPAETFKILAAVGLVRSDAVVAE
jgi:biotin transport system substrate-specific component